MNLEKAFLENLRDNKWTDHPNPFLLAVSGGIDSMVMADLFLKSDQKFAVAHCNYQLRGDAANKDEQLVATWCREHAVPFFVNHFETTDIAKEWKKGIQETARKLRYDWFTELLQQHGYKFIATAHHANDTVETLLINLFKGTGIKGLQAIPRQNGSIIRPLLFASRALIADYATTNNIVYREDASNASDKYLRNAVRNQLLPKIESYFPEAGKKMFESIQRFAEAGMFDKQAVVSRIKKLLEQRGKDIYIPTRKLDKVIPLNTICYELFKPYGFSKEQTQLLIGLIHADSGKFLLSDTHKVIKDRDFLIVTRLTPAETDLIQVDHFPATVSVANAVFSFSVSKKPDVIPASTHIAYIDFTLVGKPLLLRRWRQGDYFYPLGMNKKKKNDDSNRKMDNYPSNNQKSNDPKEQQHMDSTINNHR